ncbi:MAG: transglutaminase domain-containing protein [Candidatus Cohnella colombiensis]|uniref:Transglutaminase domain-containing protein n=1 Tax=Candidatus Cohnella colombiensis TaxID=3121368 RepID=A0AA95EXH1_9BACL|nr:MAG: transglutaminase domain-containing protein [Cohnella sp.]
MRKLLKITITFAFLLSLLPITAQYQYNSTAFAAKISAKDQFYQEVVDALTERLAAITVIYTGNEKTLKKDIKSTLDAAINSNDYLHYTLKKYGYTASITGATATIKFNFTYWESLEETKVVKDTVRQALSKIITKNMNDHQKAKAINDWIVTTLSYDTSLTAYSAYDGITNGTTVCQGYALLTYEMMNQAGIPVKIIEGTSRGISHAWNLVKLSGNWYHLDTTWNDPIPDVAGRVSYDYYNLTDTEIRKDHSWKKSSSLPLAITSYEKTLLALSAKEKNRATFYTSFYNQIGFNYLSDEYTVSSAQELKSKISAAVTARETTLIIRYTKGSSIQKDMKAAFVGIKGLKSYQYTYENFARTSINDKIVKITINYVK